MAPTTPAKTTKSVSASGNARVVTTATSSHSKAAAPAEPTRELTVEAKPFGIKTKGQSVCAVVAGSQAEKLGVAVGWEVLTIAGKKMKGEKEITASLGEAKKAGKKYKVVFRIPGGGGGGGGAATEGGGAAAAEAEAAAAAAAAAAAMEAEEAAALKAAAEAKAAEEEAARKLANGNGQVVLNCKFNLFISCVIFLLLYMFPHLSVLTWLHPPPTLPTPTPPLPVL
jgi:hypothetical protein